MQTQRAPHRILFVCMGNICRSPAAEIIFRALVESEGRGGEFEIDSAGTIGYHQGSPPDSRMAASLSRQGFQVSGRARQIEKSDLEAYDWIITMDESNLEDVRNLDPEGRFRHKVRPLVDYCSEFDVPRVPDPYYGGQKGFDLVIDLLKDASRGILRSLRS